MPRRPRQFRRGPFDLWGFLKRRLWDTTVGGPSVAATATVTGLTSTSVLGSALATGGALNSVTGLTSSSAEGIETEHGGASKSVIGQTSSSVLASVASTGGASKAIIGQASSEVLGTVAGAAGATAPVVGQASNSTEGIESGLGGASGAIIGLASSESLASVSAFGAAVAPTTGFHSTEVLGFQGSTVEPAPVQGGGNGGAFALFNFERRVLPKSGRAFVEGFASLSELARVEARGVQRPAALDIEWLAPETIVRPFLPALAQHIDTAVENSSGWTEDEELIALLMYAEAA